MDDLTKPYELTFEKRDSYLYARIIAAETDVATALEYWKKIVDKCHELAVKRLMVEQAILGGLSLADTLTVKKALIELGIKDIKIALTDPYPENYAEHRFGELVGNNRGVNILFFTTVPEAEAWLLD